MTVRTFAIAAATFSIFLTSDLRGEEEKTEIEEMDQLLSLYRSQVDSRVDNEYRANLEQLKNNYIGALERAQKNSQQSGNLEEALSFQREIDSFSTEGEFARDADTETILRLRGVFGAGQERLLKERMAKMAPLNRTLLDELDRLILAFTQAGRLEDAVVAREKKEEVAESMKMTPKVPVLFKGELRIKVDIPHISELKVRGSEVWIDHTNGQGAYPGLREDPLPTYVEGDSWMPKWEGSKTERYSLEFSLPLEEITTAIEKKGGRGTIFLREQPTKENDYTITIGLHDLAGGSAYTEFLLTW